MLRTFSTIGTRVDVKVGVLFGDEPVKLRCLPAPFICECVSTRVMTIKTGERTLPTFSGEPGGKVLTSRGTPVLEAIRDIGLTGASLPVDLLRLDPGTVFVSAHHRLGAILR
jgi:hypothetical protein